jgi:hypothetical protein
MARGTPDVKNTHQENSHENAGNDIVFRSFCVCVCVGGGGDVGVGLFVQSSSCPPLVYLLYLFVESFCVAVG